MVVGREIKGKNKEIQIIKKRFGRMDFLFGCDNYNEDLAQGK